MRKNFPQVVGGNADAVIGNTDANEPFSGTLDEVRAYNFALSAAQIVSAMNTAINPLTIIQPPLKLFANSAAIKLLPNAAAIKMRGQ